MRSRSPEFSPAESNEVSERLNNILGAHNPWIKESKNARTFLRPPKRLQLGTRLGFGRRTLTKRDSVINSKFRAHWRRSVTDEDEIELRDSFDEALTALQLLELAIETGYLHTKDVGPRASKLISMLLWANGSIKFIEYYDYIAVRYLAQRCDVELPLKKLIPPAPTSGATQFATFLSEYRTWYNNEALDWWLGLLDGFALDEEDFYEDEAFYGFLRTGRLPDDSASTEERFHERAAGISKFLFSLVSIFRQAPKNVQGSYGFFFVYWLAKFFGYEMDDKGYHRDAANLYDWSSAIVDNPAFTLQRTSSMSSNLAALKSDIELLRDVFKISRGIARSSLKSY